VSATEEEVLRAYLSAAACFRLRERFRQVETLPGVDAVSRLEALAELVRLGRRATRWLLRHERRNLDVALLTDRYREPIEVLRGEPEALFSATVRARRQERLERLLGRGIPAATAEELAGSADLAAALTVTSAALSCQAEPRVLVQAYGQLGERLGVEWLINRVALFPTVSHWQTMERDSLIDDLVMEQGRLAALVLRDCAGNVEEWLEANRALADGWQRTIDDARHASISDFALYAVTCRKLIDLGRRV
jgi:glutamate dehydrogenase